MIPHANNIAQFGGALQNTNPGVIIPAADLKNWFVVAGGVLSSTANNYISLGKRGVDYQVTAAKTFVAPGFYAAIGSAGSNFAIGYADAALAAHDTATPPTNALSLFGPDLTVANQGLASNAANTITWYPYPIIVPASKYLWCKTAASTALIQVLIIGKEVD